MNSEEQTAPPQGVAVVTTPKGEQHSEGQGGGRRRRRHRNRRHKHKHKHRQKLPAPPSQQVTASEDRPPVTEGTELHQARQNHSTYDRDLHHRSQGGTGYGMKRDHVATESELSGANIPATLLPSYAHSLARMGIHLPPDTTPSDPTITDAQQQAWEEQQMRQAHERDQQNPTESKEESKG